MKRSLMEWLAFGFTMLMILVSAGLLVYMALNIKRPL